MGTFNKWEHLVLKGEFAERKKILSGLTLEQVTKKHSPKLHTIYDELWHMSGWQHIVINNDTEMDKVWQQGNVFPAAQAASQEEWDELVKKFLADLDKIMDFTRSPEALNEDAGEGATVEDNLYCLLIHNSYHLAKIVSLRQMMDAWPPEIEKKN
jgi:uncharacterized damage-inducible protein DinB